MLRSIARLKIISLSLIYSSTIIKSSPLIQPASTLLSCNSIHCWSTMAWRSHGTSNENLINNLKRNNIISDQRVINAMLAVSRGDFTDYSPYQDAPQSIGYGVTISAPHMHGYALEHLKSNLKEGSVALDVGSGSGYLTTCMAIMAGATGRVIGIEHMPELAEQSKKNIAKKHNDLITSGRLKIIGN